MKYVYTCMCICVCIFMHIYLHVIYVYILHFYAQIQSCLKNILSLLPASIFVQYSVLWNLSNFPQCTASFSVANSKFAFTCRHFICPALRGIINHISLLGYLRMFIYVRCFFGKMHYKEGIES